MTTETIYRKQIRPVIVHGTEVMDRIFPDEASSGAQPLSWLLGVGRAGACRRPHTC